MTIFKNTKYTHLLKLITLSLLLVTRSMAVAAVSYDPDLEWKSLRTEHFWIHFHQGLDLVAIRLSKIAEQIHSRLVSDIGWQPANRTDIILVDNMDLANGSATVFPFNRIEIYISRPEPDSVLHNFDEWLTLVFTHEYTHILNMDTVHGLPAATRAVLGRVCFPNACVPIWMLEGNAVYHESRYSSYGRNNSTYTDMVMRTEILADHFAPISKASVYPRDWPSGNIPYLYGGLFVQFLEDKYGRNTFAKVFHENADNIVPYSDNIYPIPYFYNKDIKDIYDKSSPKLWEEFQSYLTKKYSLQIQQIEKEALTTSSVLSHNEQNALYPRFSRDGKNIYYVAFSTTGNTRLIQYNRETHKTKNLCNLKYPGSLSVAPDDAIIVSDIEYYGSFSLYSEAHRYHDNDYDQLTSGLRGKYLDVSPDGKQIAYVHNTNNRYSLIISDRSFANKTYLLKESPLQISDTRFSPDGSKLVFTFKDKKGHNDIAFLDLRTQSITRLTEDAYNDITPSWHPKGNKILFTSDRTGTYNIYEYDLTTKTLSRLTNMLGGAFYPDSAPDGTTLVCASYQAKGHTISILPYPEKTYSQSKAATSSMSLDYFKADDSALIIEAASSDSLYIENYNPWRSGYPALFIPLLPLVASEEIYPDEYDGAFGLISMGMDTLYRHSYYLAGLIYRKQKRAEINVSYTYSGWYPNISFGYYDETLFVGNDDFPWEDEHNHHLKRTLERDIYTSVLFPFLKMNYQHYLQCSYIYEKDVIDEYFPQSGTIYNQETQLARVQGVYFFNNAKLYPYSISNEDGFDLTLIGDYYHENLASDFTFYKVRSECNIYLPGIFNNNVLFLRARGGISVDNPDYLAPYTLGRFEKGERGTPENDEDSWGLRGYPAGIYYGNKLATATLEYRLPLIQADAGLLTFPVMFRDLWLSGFYEYGNVWDDAYNAYKSEDFKRSAGAELHLNLTLGYFIDLSGYIGYAHGFDENGEDQIYFAISSMVEGAFDSKHHKKKLDYL